MKMKVQYLEANSKIVLLRVKNPPFAPAVGDYVELPICGDTLLYKIIRRNFYSTQNILNIWCSR